MLTEKTRLIFLFSLSTIGIFTFQNCDVRRIDSTNRLGNLTTIGLPSTQTGTPTPTPGLSPTPNPTPIPSPTPTPAPVCLNDANQFPALTGINNLPTVKSSYAAVTRYDSQYYKSTSLMVSTSSSCFSENDITKPISCPSPTPTPTCNDHSASLGITVMLTCDGTSSTATSCTNFASYLNQEIKLSDSQWTGKISIIVSNVEDQCDSTRTSALSQSYTAPVGSIKITSLPNINNGSVATIQLLGVQVSSLSGPTRSGTLSGTISGKILSLPSSPTCN